MNWILLLLTLAATWQSPWQSNAAFSSPNTTIASRIEIDSHTLPGLNGMREMKDAYTVEEVILSIPSKVTGTSMIKIVVTGDQELVLERIGKNPTVYVSYILDIGSFNPYMLSLKSEWTDANYDTDDDDLVLWWSTGESNNGITSGFETQRDGVMIINVTDMQDIVNFTYLDESHSYSAGKNADTEAEDYHAKMDDNSIWEACSHSFDVQLKEGDLYLSNFQKEVEGSSECVILQHTEGKYEYDILSGKYELNQ